jgi:hypothetical protein
MAERIPTMPDPDTAFYLIFALCGALALVAEGLWGVLACKGWK